MALIRYNTVLAAVAAVPATSLNALADNAYVLGAAINNTPASSAATMATLEIALTSGLTTGAGSPGINIFLLPSVAGTNYPTTNGGITAGPTAAQHFVGRIALPPSTFVQFMSFDKIELPPFNFTMLLQFQLGAPLPAVNTHAANLTRYGFQVT